MPDPRSQRLDRRIEAVSRMIRGIGRDLSEWEVDDLCEIDRLAAQLDGLRGRVVYALREHGVTDRQIADTLGVTQQAVSKRWPGGGRYVGAAGRYRTPPPHRGSIR